MNIYSTDIVTNQEGKKLATTNRGEWTSFKIKKTSLVLSENIYSFKMGESQFDVTLMLHECDCDQNS